MFQGAADLSKKLLDLVPKDIYNKLEQIDLNKPLNKKSNIYVNITIWQIHHEEQII